VESTNINTENTSDIQVCLNHLVYRR